MLFTKIRSKSQVKTRQNVQFYSLLLLIKEFELGLNLGEKPSKTQTKLINKQVFEIVKGFSNA
jgi:hypothetical protein